MASRTIISVEDAMEKTPMEKIPISRKFGPPTPEVSVQMAKRVTTSALTVGNSTTSPKIAKNTIKNEARWSPTREERKGKDKMATRVAKTLAEAGMVEDQDTAEEADIAEVVVTAEDVVAHLTPPAKDRHTRWKKLAMSAMSTSARKRRKMSKRARKARREKPRGWC
jgi:hypothetical protein